MSGVVFYSAFNRPVSIPTVSGSKEIPDLYLRVVDGFELLVSKQAKDGKKIMRDIYSPKQEALEGSYLPRMIERFLNGSISPEQFEVFKNPQSWTDIDVTHAPKTLAEALQLQIDSDNAFMSLDPKLRDVFGNNQFNFMSSLQDGSFYERLARAGFVPKTAENTSKISKVSKDIKKSQIKEGDSNE